LKQRNDDSAVVTCLSHEWKKLKNQPVGSAIHRTLALPLQINRRWGILRAQFVSPRRPEAYSDGAVL